MTLTAARLREVLNYDSLTGEFTYRIKRRKCLAGSRAGCVDRANGGYHRIRLDYRMYLGHRLAWLHVHGEWPGMIDHIDGNPSNNAIANLREATPAENNRNKRVARSKPGGIKGVYFIEKTGLWAAGITVDGVFHYLGHHETAEAARAAYNEAATRLHGEFARAA